jgi:hypothetical protein
MFERQLHWFSYIAAEVLLTDSDARQEMAFYLGNSSTDSIKAEDLIGVNSIPAFNSFSHAFYATTLYYLSGPGWPGAGDPKPRVPPAQGGFPNASPPWTTAFYQALLETNCVELYLPNGVDFSNGFDLTSSAHPLTNGPCNEGYFVINGLGGVVTSSIIDLTQGYVNTHDNVLIARPFRSVPSDCYYFEYNGIDFEDFMD